MNQFYKVELNLNSIIKKKLFKIKFKVLNSIILA